MSATPDWSRGGARFVCALLVVIVGFAGFARSKELVPSERAERIEVLSGIDVNRARESELSLLPGIGPALSGAIVRERETGGRFVDLDDLTRVKGIGERRVMALRGHAVVASP